MKFLTVDVHLLLQYKRSFLFLIFAELSMPFLNCSAVYSSPHIPLLYIPSPL